MPAPSGKQGCTRRATTALLLATSRAAVADGATPLLSEPRWAPPTNSPQDDDARYADSTTALSVRSCSITTGRAAHRDRPGGHVPGTGGTAPRRRQRRRGAVRPSRSEASHPESAVTIRGFRG